MKLEAQCAAHWSGPHPIAQLAQARTGGVGGGKRLKPGGYPRLNSGVKSARLRDKGHPAENLTPELNRRQAGGRSSYYTN
eukprot:4210566-Pyramimonas_sp.AAC.1